MIKSIKELHEYYHDSEDLEIRVDNDCTSVWDKQLAEKNSEAACIFDGDGYRDVMELWALLFPKSDVDWV